MVTTVNAGFESLKSNLEITDLQQSTVSTRQNNVRDAVEKELLVLNSFLTGSYAKSTMISPLKEADIDIFIVLDPKYYNSEHPECVLDKVRNTLLKTYTTSKISRNGQAVTITFGDFIVDVVPAFNRKGGGYLIANSYTKKWISTDPTISADLLASENKNHIGDLVPLIKMIKGWNKASGSLFVSFYLELIAIELLKGVTISNFHSGVRFFFDKGRTRIKNKVKDPAGFGDYINPLRKDLKIQTVEDAIKAFETAYEIAIQAENYARNNNNSKAIDEWKKIFGSYFPSYG